MREGRWKTVRMPMRYGEHVMAAARGGMARAAKEQGESSEFAEILFCKLWTLKPIRRYRQVSACVPTYSEAKSMISIEDIKPGLSLSGLEPAMIVSVIAAVPIGTGAVQVIYKLADGTIRERMISDTDIVSVAIATAELPWSFDGDGDAFQARRGSQAHRPRVPFRPDDGRPHVERASRCRTRSPLFTSPCCRASRCASSLPTTPAPARPSWPASTSANSSCAPTPAASSSSRPAAWSSNGATNCSRSSAWSSASFPPPWRHATPTGNPFEDHRSPHRPA